MFDQPTIEFPTAFLAGLLSFVSPCVLPLIPGYLSYISGVSVEDLMSKEKKDASHLRKLLINTLFFVLGFSLVFVLLGLAASGIGAWLRQNAALFNRVAGVIVFLFGLHVSGILKVRALNYEKRFHVTGAKKRGVLGSALIGIAFGFGWTPCIGPILGAILALAAQQKSMVTGAWLLVVYSAGLGIPFILTALLFSYLMGAFGFIKRHFRAVEIISGGLLMLVGILMFFNLLAVLANRMLDWFPFLNMG